MEQGGNVDGARVARVATARPTAQLGTCAARGRINHVRHCGQYRLELRFTDGTKGTIDLRERIAGRGGVFAALNDPAIFGQVKVDREAGTIVWPNGVDLCPDVLYSLVTGIPIEQPKPALSHR